MPSHCLLRPFPLAAPQTPGLPPSPGIMYSVKVGGAQKWAGASKKAKDVNTNESNRSFAFFEKGAVRHADCI